MPRRGGPPKKQKIPGVKHVIAVTSGKGGVGKSTVAGKLICVSVSFSKTKMTNCSPKPISLWQYPTSLWEHRTTHQSRGTHGWDFLISTSLVHRFPSLWVWRMRENRCLANVSLSGGCPSQLYMQAHGRLVLYRRKANKLIPMNNHGIKTMSIGYLLRNYSP